MMLSGKTLATILASIACLNASEALAAIKIHLEYDFIDNEISPQTEEHRTHGTSDYVLDGHQISSIGSDKGSTEKIRTLGSTVLSKSDFGMPDYRVTTRIRKNAIEITATSETSTRTTTIMTDGTSQCSATRTARLRPGHKYFIDRRVSNHELMYETEQRWENITCSIMSE